MARSLTELYGLEVQEMDEELRRALGHEGRGVLVANVVPETPAHETGIRPGDVLERIQGKSVGTPAELEEALETSQGKKGLELFRQGKRLKLVLPELPRR